MQPLDVDVGLFEFIDEDADLFGQIHRIALGCGTHTGQVVVLPHMRRVFVNGFQLVPRIEYVVTATTARSSRRDLAKDG